MSAILKNIETIQHSIPNHIQIVLATKYASIDDIGLISNAFPEITFGENRVQHGQEKQIAYPNIKNPWHFIGHLQRNKVKKVIENYSLIHSVDSLRLLTEINTAAEKQGLQAQVLLQVNPINEETKFGFSIEEVYNALTQTKTLKNITLSGLMCMAPHTDNKSTIRKTFKKTRELYDNIKISHAQFNHLSMGMSNDYQIAIDEGSTMIRIGSIIFK
ncbi:MAG: YggS family pyridoxal phosphate-dependent enzyme [Candidatus Margulisiibacteriota bacterium]